jgi:hypothetical protein
MRRIVPVLLLILLSCGEPSSFQISIAFPDQAAKDRTAQVAVLVIKPDAAALCQALLDGQAIAGDPGYPIEDQIGVAYPPTEVPGPLDVIGAGRRLFEAEAEDDQAVVFLRGCTEADASGSGVHTVRIVLEPMETICQQDADCDDDNPCTDDSCEANGQCGHADNTADCDDGSYCNGADTCAAGACAHAGDPCEIQGKVCDEDQDSCRDCSQDLDCDDQNPCTADSCGGGSCGHAPQGGACDDGVFCNGTDSCASGSCQHSGDPCTVQGKPCDEVRGICLECSQGPECDDQNPCTADSCNDGACAHSPQAGSCDDGLYCNGNDSCTGGACQHSGDPCAVQGKPCDENADACFACTQDADCEDFNPCTADSCAGGTCGYTPQGGVCDDGVFCNGADSCAGGVCTHAGDPCVPSGQTCDENTTSCWACLVDGDCPDDGNQCTDRRCNVGTCANPPVTDGLSCNDGLYCRVGETCQQGQCLGSPRDCDDGDSCTVDSCDETAAACDNVWTPKPGAEGPPANPSCGNGIDDDCDGWTDRSDLSCFQPSNMSAETAAALDSPALSSLVFSGAASPVTVNTDDGSIVDGVGAVLRPVGEGVLNGIFFEVAPLPGSATDSAGVFAATRVTVPAGLTVIGVGQNPMIVLAREGVDIYGTIDVGARREATAAAPAGDHLAGPGAFTGGMAGLAGFGDCAGGADGGLYCSSGTTSGGGGGGFGGQGGKGGDGSAPSEGCATVFLGGPGGGICPDASLMPLVGGSGGGGGGVAQGATSTPGEGGAGGGALQITCLSTLHLFAGAVVTAPGGGGGGGTNIVGGGGGGGAGGALLLEADEVILEDLSVVAANGGGGGSGDCS